MARPDAIVLGGGIIGAALAEELARRGQRIILVERGRIGVEASSAAAGILSAQMDLPVPGPLLEFCQASRRLYPRWVRHLERRSGIRIGFHVDGILYLAMRPGEERSMARRMRWQRARGLRVERWSRAEVRRREPAVDGTIRCGFFFPREAQVDNVALMRALAVACRTAGVEVHEKTAVRRLRLRHGAVRGVETTRGVLEATVVVNCLGSWANMDGAFPVRLPIEPARGQMLGFQGPRRLLRHVVMAERAYVVQRRDGRLLVGSTIEHAGFDKALTLTGITGILSGLSAFTSVLSRCTFVEGWAGLRPHAAHGRPIIGKTSIGGLCVATGHFRHGILLAPMTAQAMADLLLRGRPSFDLAPFAPSRIRHGS